MKNKEILSLFSQPKKQYKYVGLYFDTYKSMDLFCGEFAKLNVGDIIQANIKYYYQNNKIEKLYFVEFPIHFDETIKKIKKLIKKYSSKITSSGY